jgi:Flp pilus assembly protein TadD
MTDTDTHGIVTSDRVKRKRHIGVSRRTIVTIVIIFAAVLIVVGVLLARLDVKNRQVDKQTAQVAPTPPITPSSQANSLALSGDYAGAQKLLDAARAKTEDSKSQAALYLSQATISLNSGNYTDAKTYATAADKLTPTPNTAALLGYIAAQTGDKVTARSFYQQAIDRLDKNANDYNTSLSDYKAKLQDLQ